MTERERKLREDRAKVTHDYRAILDKADEEKRELTSDERDSIARMDTELGDFEIKIQAARKLGDIEGEYRGTDNPPLSAEPEAREQNKDEHRDMVATVLRTFDENRGNDNVRDLARASVGAEKFHRMQSAIFRRYLLDGKGAITQQEARALQLDSDVGGGYLVAPEQFVEQLIQAVDDALYMRQLATKFTVIGAKSLGAPSLDTDPVDASWTGEVTEVTEDNSMALGKRQMIPHPLAKLIKISRDLLRASGRAESIARERISYHLAYPMENGYLNGSGSNQPLGVNTASDYGISTSRDVSTGNTTTSINTDGLIEAKWSIKSNYWGRPGFKWMFHRDALKQIRKLKDGEGQYIWQQGITVDVPDRILETPYLMSELMPNTFTTGLYVGIIGDFAFYWIVDALDMEIQRLDELYALTNQIGLITRAKSDGMPVLEEAFARVTLA